MGERLLTDHAPLRKPVFCSWLLFDHTAASVPMGSEQISVAVQHPVIWWPGQRWVVAVGERRIGGSTMQTPNLPTVRVCLSVWNKGRIS